MSTLDTKLSLRALQIPKYLESIPDTKIPQKYFRQLIFLEMLTVL